MIIKKKKQKKDKTHRRGKSSAATSKRLPSPQQILDYFATPEYRPRPMKELAAALHVPKAQRDCFNATLKGMADSGLIVKTKKGFALPKNDELIRGQITITRGRGGFVKDTDTGKEVFVPAPSTSTALHGDRVVVKLRRQVGEKTKGHLGEGTVVDVLERNTRTVVGTLRRKRKAYVVEPLRATIAHDILIVEPGDVELGERVLVRLDDWDDAGRRPEGEIVERIGPADDPAFDTLSVMKSYNLEREFPPPVVASAERAELTEADCEGRLDLRDKFVFTIDPDTARDFDDALSLERQGRNKWLLGIHIADVSHYVRPGTALDEEAYRRGTSVYFPDGVIPMLPEQLSNGLCSLVPHRDRLAFSVLVTLSETGDILDAEFCETVIHSKLRLTYEQALQALEAPDGSAFPEFGMGKRAVRKLKTVHGLAQSLRRRRMTDGAFNLDLPEVRFQFGEHGSIDAIVPQENDISHQLIEECMLLANEVVCRHLADADVPQVFRIHDAPDPNKLAELEEQLMLAGFQVSDLSDRRNMSHLVEEIAGTPAAHACHMAILRAMKRAQYSETPIGHFGLAKYYYCHFTSPIRRYPDLIQHRILKRHLTGKAPQIGKQRLAEMSGHCTAREDVALESERDIVELKKLRYFADELASGEPKSYHAIVVGVRSFGVMIDLPDIQTYGMIHVSQLQDDYYEYNAAGQELVGQANGVRFSFGLSLEVVIASVDMTKRFLDFAPVGMAKRQGKAETRKGSRRPRMDEPLRARKKGRRGRQPTDSARRVKKKRRH